MRSFLSFFAAMSIVVSTIACSGGGVPTAPSPGPTSPSVPPPNTSPVGPIPVISISVGEVVHASVGLADPICDPSGWDATAPCKRFGVVATHDGTIQVTLKATPPQPLDDVIDLILRCANGGGDYSGGGKEQLVTAPVNSGQLCEITVNLYPYSMRTSGNVAFELRAEM